MELLFEAEGPVVRDRVTKKKCNLRNSLYKERWTLLGERVVDPDITRETKTFGNFPCPIYILAENQMMEVMMFLYRPGTTHPIYASVALSSDLWEVRNYINHGEHAVGSSKLHKSRTTIKWQSLGVVHRKIYKWIFLKLHLVGFVGCLLEWVSSSSIKTHI